MLAIGAHAFTRAREESLVSERKREQCRLKQTIAEPYEGPQKRKSSSPHISLTMLFASLSSDCHFLLDFDFLLSLQFSFSYFYSSPLPIPPSSHPISVHLFPLLPDLPSPSITIAPPPPPPLSPSLSLSLSPPRARSPFVLSERCPPRSPLPLPLPLVLSTLFVPARALPIHSYSLLALPSQATAVTGEWPLSRPVSSTEYESGLRRGHVPVARLLGFGPAGTSRLTGLVRAGQGDGGR
ncbi:hypothetical protein Mp_8g05660 [Marchantia polymorpha subsp. ruderalis]|uniref:Uncharacterized protein n=1 Tax=Marchantia polymorpha TaxID=3197 RepID=A0A2R6WKF9_MARPO|nr:hypothetical protein MARPO_0081s0067 [Marchantia polymorpha]BBN18806.1 hypothetical protein Mp_8g05660 [Marchantia polymorpha subsp. ruderalis]|eukprot:PTQ34344.1 hypothetical protein MARPO_0081s0067 [Marchantia polymorpha]